MEGLEKERTGKSMFLFRPFQICEISFHQKKGGTLKTSKQVLEEHLERTQSDPKRHEQIVSPSDIPPIEQPEHLMDVSPL